MILTLEIPKSFLIFKKLLDSGTFIKFSYFRFKKLWQSGGQKEPKIAKNAKSLKKLLN